MQSYKLFSLDLASRSQLPDRDFVIGEPTRRERKKLTKEDQQNSELLGIRSFFTTVSAFLQSRLLFENKLLRYLSCLSLKGDQTQVSKLLNMLVLSYETQLQILQNCRMNVD